ncbi:uncharacterized protein SCHCODRAFT_02501085 [Schizophyllum commune H4-8]|uniref:uncharacterized protein n=1 Tax=Schizophyllum commune (strain H4-8 / FGSC 9210) TaxID=578458 RepID=UPI0021609DB2|nr:uncharacterized protein SCHCODRAFT_02501085 [Schizophyllum commune H4-8]KAI5893923.1 hypothetical protein SCHCODRAFT_02501085 [Schizophyllum commune H4-8]
MHRALQIPELLSLICKYADSRSKADLAQTCRYLLEPVLDELWALQIADTAILGVLPPDSIVTMEDEDDVTLEFMRYTPSDKEWDRIYYYTKRVRVLNVELNQRNGCPPQFALSDNFLRQWMKYTRKRGIGLALYPNATDVYWTVEGPQSLQRDQMIWLPPGITCLTLDLKSLNKHSALTLANALNPLARRKLASLRKLWIQQLMIRPMEMSALEPLMRSCPALNDVGFLNTTPDCVRQLATFPNVRHLNIGNVALYGSRMNVRNRDDLPDHSRLDEGILSFWRQLCSSLPLETLRVRYRPHALLPADVLVPFFQIFGQSLNPALITSLRLIALSARTRSPAILSHAEIDHELTRDHIAPLMALRNLRELEISPRGWVNVDDADVLAFAQAWPHLEELRFSGRLSRTYPPHAENEIPIRTTMAALYALATHCPRLRVLELSFDASTVPPSPITTPVVQHALRELFLGGTEWQDSQRLAEFLLSVFPQLREVDSHASHWMEMREGVIDIFSRPGPAQQRLRELRELVSPGPAAPIS